VIASEDQRFFDHADSTGRHPVRFHRQRQGQAQAGGQHITSKREESFPVAGPQLDAQGLEAYFTLLLELLWSKHRILEVY